MHLYCIILFSLITGLYSAQYLADPNYSGRGTEGLSILFVIVVVVVIIVVFVFCFVLFFSTNGILTQYNIIIRSPPPPCGFD